MSDLPPELYATEFRLRRDLIDQRYFIAIPGASEPVLVAKKRINKPQLPFWSIQTPAGRPFLEIEWPTFALARQKQLRLVNAVGSDLATVEPGYRNWTVRDLAGEEVVSARRRGLPLPVRLLLNEIYLGGLPLPYGFDLSRSGRPVGTFRRRMRLRHHYSLVLDLGVEPQHRLEIVGLAVALAEQEQAGTTET
jgi:hypothetical protein